jgi:hypothetical protein
MGTMRLLSEYYFLSPLISSAISRFMFEILNDATNWRGLLLLVTPLRLFLFDQIYNPLAFWPVRGSR